MSRRRLTETGGVDTDDLIRSAMRGRNPSRVASPEEINEFLTKVSKVLLGASEPGERTHRGVHVVTIYNPEKRTYFTHLMKDGKIILGDDFGEELNQDELITDKRDLLRLVSEEGATTQIQTRGGSGGGGESGTKRKPTHRFHPALRDYIRNKAVYLSSVVSETGDPKDVTRTVTREELEMANARLAILVNENGLEVRAQTIERFIRSGRKAISDMRVVYHKAMMREPPVLNVVTSFLSHIRSQCDDPVEFYKDGGRAREVYEWIGGNNETKYSNSNMLWVLRASILNLHQSTRDPTRKPILAATGEWLKMGQAACCLASDPQLLDGVDLSVEDGDEMRASDRVFEVIRRLAYAVVVDRTYSTGEFEFMVRGLWVRGDLEKTLGNAHLEPGEERSYRAPRGAISQFVGPVNHITKRFEPYRLVVQQGLHNALEEGEIPLELELATPVQYDRFSKIVWEHIPEETRTETFTRLKGDQPLVVGSYLTKLLQMQIAIDREDILGRVRAYHGGTS